MDSSHKNQGRGALMFFMCVRTNVWANSREAGDLRRHKSRCDVTVMEYHNGRCSNCINYNYVSASVALSMRKLLWCELIKFLSHCSFVTQWYYGDVTMNAMAYQTTGVIAQSFVQAQIKDGSKTPRHWPMWGNPPMTGGFPSQRASNAENFSVWWRHHDASMISVAIVYHWIDKIHSYVWGWKGPWGFRFVWWPPWGQLWVKKYWTLLKHCLSSTQYELIPIIFEVWSFELIHILSANNILAGLTLNCISSIWNHYLYSAWDIVKVGLLFQCWGLNMLV